MDPLTIKIVTGVILLLISTVLSYLVYHNRRKDQRIDAISESLHKEINNIRIMQTQIMTVDTNQKLLKAEVDRIPILSEKINALENVYSVLNEINKNISEMSADIRVIKANYGHVYKELERLDKDITSVRETGHKYDQK